MPSPDEFYTDSQRELQAKHDSATLAKAVVGAIVSDEIPEEQYPFINSRDYFFLSTVNSKGQPTVSYKGGPVGVLKIKSTKQIVFPNYDGNGMFYSMGNVAEMGQVGLLLLDMETPNRLRIQGIAKLSDDAQLVSEFPGANMVVVVDITSVFVNCARYIHPHKRLSESKYVPDAEGKQPFPAWKRLDKIQGALPKVDQGRAEAEGGLIDDEKYIELLQSGKS